MRNLKKILALALALVMTFSVMSVANAFTDDADIDETYKTAVDVLAGLKVFEGYGEGENSDFRPTNSITRAEVATIIYRIATGDVDGTQVGIYADYNIFTDVPSNAWYAGYVNFCANAQYILGRGDGTFDPAGNVTGYEALAMILRAVGYGKNGEFQGANWSINTAARAESLGVSDNVTAALLGMPATREVVAELLFRSILIDTVTYTMLEGYKETGESLGYREFGLEEIVGVVMANKWANLEGTSVLAEGKTKLLVNGETTSRTLNVGSEITDIGEARSAYITGGTVLSALEDAGNDVWQPENGMGTAVSKSTVATDADTEYYVNFDPTSYYDSDYRIKYEFQVFYHLAAPSTTILSNAELFTAIKNIMKDNRNFEGLTLPAAWDNVTCDFHMYDAAGDRIAFPATGNTTAAPIASYRFVYTVEFRVGDEISQTHLDNIEALFSIADKYYDGVRNYDIGEVYVGTTSTDDISDDRDVSFNVFVDKYINDNLKKSFSASDNGEWLKVIDNDGDGKAEYAFLTQFNLDEVIDTYTKSGTEYLEYRNLDIITEYDALYVDEVAVGDIVLYAVVDGQAIITLAESEEMDINSVSFREQTVTTTNGDVYNQSEIENWTNMDDVITDMDEALTYLVYLDAFGHIRAYKPVDGTKYALVTEMYYNYYDNGRYVETNTLYAEVTPGNAKTEEFVVLNKTGNDFLLNINNDAYTDNWSMLNAPNYTAGRYNPIRNNAGRDVSGDIVLQPATEHLGYTGVNGERRADFFDPARTNVARYVMTDDGVRLESAAELKNGKYTVDYVELDASYGVAADQRLWRMVERTAAGAYDYLNAVHGTEFYIVSDSGVTCFTDYDNVPKITVDIQAMYAVARNVASDKDSTDYWVADVIVIEAEDWNVNYDSISLAFYNHAQTSGRVQMLETLNNEAKGVYAQVIPSERTWGSQWQDWGFYALRNTTTEEDGTIVADRINRIPGTGETYSKYGIYAGVIHEIKAVENEGGYIVVDKAGILPSGATAKAVTPISGTTNIFDTVNVSGDEVFAIGTTRADGNNCEHEQLHLGDSRYTNVEKGDRIIWVKDGSGTTFIIDLSYSNGSWGTPDWLNRIYNAIINEQINAGAGTITYAQAVANAEQVLVNPAATETALRNALADLYKVTGSNDAEKGKLAELITAINNRLSSIDAGTAEKTAGDALIAAVNAWGSAAPGAAKDAAAKTMFEKAVAYKQHYPATDPAPPTDAQAAYMAARDEADKLVYAVTGAGGTISGTTPLTVPADTLTDAKTNKEALAKVTTDVLAIASASRTVDFAAKKTSIDADTVLYDLAYDLVKAANDCDNAVIQTEAMKNALINAFNAISPAQHTKISDNFSDSGKGGTAGDGYKFGGTLNDYTDAYDDAKTLASAAKTVTVQLTGTSPDGQVQINNKDYEVVLTAGTEKISTGDGGVGSGKSFMQLPGEAFTFTLSYRTDLYTAPTVTYTSGAAAAVTLSADANGSYTIPASAMIGTVAVHVALKNVNSATGLETDKRNATTALGIEVATTGNTIAITVDSAGLASAANLAANVGFVNQLKGGSNTATVTSEIDSTNTSLAVAKVLYVPIQFEAPAGAQSARMKVVSNGGTATITGGETLKKATDTSGGFRNGAVHWYCPVAEDTASSGDPAWAVIPSGKTWSVAIQFYSDANGTAPMGEPVIYTVTRTIGVSAPVAP